MITPENKVKRDLKGRTIKTVNVRQSTHKYNTTGKLLAIESFEFEDGTIFYFSTEEHEFNAIHADGELARVDG